MTAGPENAIAVAFEEDDARLVVRALQAMSARDGDHALRAARRDDVVKARRLDERAARADKLAADLAHLLP